MMFLCLMLQFVFPFFLICSGLFGMRVFSGLVGCLFCGVVVVVLCC